MTETCALCDRAAVVEYRLIRPLEELLRFWCSTHALMFVGVSPARDFERLETPLDRLHQLVSV